MGICWNCGIVVILRDEEVRCDRCKKIVRYWCNGCSKPFDVQDKKTKKKVKDCKWCYYFICPNCKTCSQTCPKFTHQNKLRGFLKDTIPIDRWEELNDKIKKIVEYFEQLKLGMKKTTCEFGVPKTYAKDKIKHILARMDGFKVRDVNDQKAFEQRNEEILYKEIGDELTIRNSRENGSYGQEHRDVFNLGVCMGKLKYERKKYKNKKGIETGYDSWIRIDEAPCEFLDTKELIVKECPECHKTFNRNQNYCNECKYKVNHKEYNKGDLKNKPLREKTSDNPTCRNLNNFKEVKDGESQSKSEKDVGKITEW